LSHNREGHGIANATAKMSRRFIFSSSIKLKSHLLHNSCNVDWERRRGLDMRRAGEIRGVQVLEPCGIRSTEAQLSHYCRQS
jgi:hypothetical protein